MASSVDRGEGEGPLELLEVWRKSYDENAGPGSKVKRLIEIYRPAAEVLSGKVDEHFGSIKGLELGEGKNEWLYGGLVDQLVELARNSGSVSESFAENFSGILDTLVERSKGTYDSVQPDVVGERYKSVHKVVQSLAHDANSKWAFSVLLNNPTEDEMRVVEEEGARAGRYVLKHAAKDLLYLDRKLWGDDFAEVFGSIYDKVLGFKDPQTRRVAAENAMNWVKTIMGELGDYPYETTRWEYNSPKFEHTINLLKRIESAHAPAARAFAQNVADLLKGGKKGYSGPRFRQVESYGQDFMDILAYTVVTAAIDGSDLAHARSEKISENAFEDLKKVGGDIREYLQLVKSEYYV